MLCSSFRISRGWRSVMIDRRAVLAPRSRRAAGYHLYEFPECAQELIVRETRRRLSGPFASHTAAARDEASADRTPSCVDPAVRPIPVGIVFARAVSTELRHLPPGKDSSDAVTFRIRIFAYAIGRERVAGRTCACDCSLIQIDQGQRGLCAARRAARKILPTASSSAASVVPACPPSLRRVL